MTRFFPVLRAGIFIFSFSVFCQKPYFQQELFYRLHAILDDQHHTLKGTEKLIYINHSDSTLPFLYFHLWPNAYKHPNTALGKQLFSQQNYVMHHLSKDDFGYIDSLRFESKGILLRTEPHPQWEDVIKVWLNKPLKPGDTVEIFTPFFVKIPNGNISRFGHIGQSYQITQWYPKPAVFDHEGWHPMPYLDQGEFYSEFATYDVYITLPENYMVATTGVLIQPEEEVDRINQRMLETIDLVDNKKVSMTMQFPPSSPKFKTLYFRQYDVHDFAWFADKRYYILHDEVELPSSGRTIHTWVYFHLDNSHIWKNALDYLNRSLLFFSEQVGEYPYSQITAVAGNNPNAGGMEYPNICLISPVSDSSELDLIIAHEVGHNWFYGLLATNERDHAWMDEGINSFYEMKYMEMYYPDKPLSKELGLDFLKFLNLHRVPSFRSHYYSYLLSARNNLDQPIELPSEKFSPLNYGVIVYSKTAQCFKMLEDFMGQNVFSEAMQFYFDKYKFTHPTPLQLLKTLEFFSVKNLDWFYQYFIKSSRKTDLAIRKAKQTKDFSYQLLVINKRKVPTPYSVSGFLKDGTRVGTVWMNPSERRKDSVFFPPSKVDFFVLDADFTIPELYRYNNYIYPEKFFKRQRKTQFKWLTSLQDDSKKQLYLIPLVGYNLYDGIMPGILLHNFALLPKPLEWYIAPFYGITSHDLSGIARMQLSFYPNDFLKSRIIQLYAETKKFSTEKIFSETKPAFYIKNSAGIYWEKKPEDFTKKIRIFLDASGHFIYDKYTLYSMSGSENTRWLGQLKGGISNYHNWAPWSIQNRSYFHSTFSRTEIEYRQAIPINERFKFTFRLFAGTILHKKGTAYYPYFFRLSGWNGFRDFAYEGFFMGRYAFTGLASQQMMERDGALKIYTPIGGFSSYVMSAYIESPGMFILPFHFYFETGTAEKNSMLKESWIWDSGICANFFKGFIRIYVPLFYSNDIKNNLRLNGITFGQTIRFSVNFENLSYRNKVNNFFLF